MDSVKVKITNWDKFNSKDFSHKYRLWFRMNIGFWGSESLFGLSVSTRLAFVYFLAIAAKQKSGTITFNKKWFEAHAALDKPLEEIIEELKERDLLSCFNSIDSQSNSIRTPIEFYSRHITEHNITEQKRVKKRTENNETTKKPLCAPSGAPPPADLVSIWNSNCGSLPKAIKLSAPRLAKWKLRFREQPDPEYWKKIVQRISESRFCNGDSSRGWRATVDWLLQTDTHLKVLEGKYDNCGTSNVVSVRKFLSLD